MLMTYTGRRPLAMPLSKDLSTLLSRVLPALAPPTAAGQARAQGGLPKPSLRDGVPPAWRPAPHRAGALGRPALRAPTLLGPCASVLTSAPPIHLSRSMTARRLVYSPSIRSRARRCP